MVMPAMKSADHYAHLAEGAVERAKGNPPIAELLLATAQVWATLAVAAATEEVHHDD